MIVSLEADMTLFRAALVLWLLPTLTFLAIAVLVYPAMVVARRLRRPAPRYVVPATDSVVPAADG